MRFNLKTLGLALVAALALSATMASAASADPDGAVVGDEHFVAHDTENANNAFTGTAGIECATATYTGTLTNSGKTIDLTPEFSNCKTSTNAPVTVDHMGCRYEIHVGTKVDVDHYDADATLVCAVGSPITVNIYNAIPHNPATPVCTLEIGNQDPADELTLTDETNGHLRLHGIVTGIANSLAGPCVGGGTVPGAAAQLHVDMTMTGGLGIEDV